MSIRQIQKKNMIRRTSGITAWRIILLVTFILSACCRMTIEAGVKLAIGTDAHSMNGLGLMDCGVATAGRGWATKSHVLNTLSLAKLKSWIKT
jgi:hypothetical protein